MRIWWSGWLLVLLGSVLAGALGWLLMQAGAHLLQDHADHHLVLELLKYNIQQGRLVPLPVGGPAPPGSLPTGRQPGPPSLPDQGPK